jgi:murein DD-endopeptidase MepM/ murein hydrolase activator NlpD
MATSALALATVLIIGAGGMSDPARPAGPAWGTYAWPAVGPVTRRFEPPPDPYGSGHRGIDIAVPVGTGIVAAQDGVVAFAGWVAGALYISIDHPDGVRTTYSWVSSASVSAGATVVRGQPIGASGTGHPGVSPPHLHFGTLEGDTYLDPMLLLEQGAVAGLIHLAPLSGSGPFAPPTGGPWSPTDYGAAPGVENEWTAGRRPGSPPSLGVAAGGSGRSPPRRSLE